MAIKFQQALRDIMADSIRVVQTKRTYGIVLVKERQTNEIVLHA
jgi:hypothetical protein